MIEFYHRSKRPLLGLFAVEWGSEDKDDGGVAHFFVPKTSGNGTIKNWFWGYHKDFTYYDGPYDGFFLGPFLYCLWRPRE